MSALLDALSCSPGVDLWGEDGRGGAGRGGEGLGGHMVVRGERTTVGWAS